MSKKRIIIIIATFLVLITAIFIFVKQSQINNETLDTTSTKGSNYAEAYFLNPSTDSLEMEKRLLQSTDVNRQIQEILEIILKSGPTNKGLKIPTATSVDLLGSNVVGDTAFVYFGENYEELTDVDKIYLKASITWSLTSIEGVNSVMFYCGENVIETESATSQQQNQSNKYDRSYVYLNPVIDPQNSVLISFKTYYPLESTNELVEEQRNNVYANPNVIKEYYIVDELIKGTTIDGHYSAIPKSTKIINVETDNRICYVNLSEDFVTKQPDDYEMNRLSVYQIVNSLTLLDDVDAVQIFIDSKKVKGFKNGLDLSEVLTADESIVGASLLEE